MLFYFQVILPTLCWRIVHKIKLNEINRTKIPIKCSKVPKQANPYNGNCDINDKMEWKRIQNRFSDRNKHCWGLKKENRR